MQILPDRSDRTRVAGWLFVLTWFLGNVALIAGFEAALGVNQEIGVLGVLALACGAWWASYRVSRYKSRGGFIVIGLWILGFVVPIMDFHYYKSSYFFWGGAILLGVLTVAAVMIRSRQR